MNARVTGNLISELRKSKGYTQSELAKKLNVSDKTISKWENGIGYPEITQFPALSNLFGVSIDYLLTGERVGICVAGNMIVDMVKSIDDFPKIGMLSEIKEISRAVGGCAPNTAINLVKIDNSLPVSVVGCVGDDENGSYLKSVMQRHGINTGLVKTIEKISTAFSDVISLEKGERTFFSYRGANDLFSPNDINVSSLKCRMLHFGYILLLASFDADDNEYGTVLARFLDKVQKRGIKVSIDVVSNNTLSEYPKKIIPALKYTDYAIMNELECCNIWGLNPYSEDGVLDIEVIKEAMKKTMDAGVKEKVIIHCKKAGFCLSSNGEFNMVGSLIIDDSMIKGSVGAGDAFCAGALYGIYNDYNDKEILEFASAAALCNLFEVNSIDGMKNKDEIFKIMSAYKRYEL